jgi:serine/threonine protein kinase
VANLEQLSIKFGYPIKDKNFKTDGLYLSPEVLAGGQSSKRSTVFSLGVILDELIHGNTFFKSIS